MLQLIALVYSVNLTICCLLLKSNRMPSLHACIELSMCVVSQKRASHCYPSLIREQLLCVIFCWNRYDLLMSSRTCFVLAWNGLGSLLFKLARIIEVMVCNDNIYECVCVSGWCPWTLGFDGNFATGCLCTFNVSFICVWVCVCVCGVQRCENITMGLQHKGGKGRGREHVRGANEDLSAT